MQYRITTKQLPSRPDLLIGVNEIVKHWQKTGSPLELSGRYRYPGMQELGHEAFSVQWTIKQTKTYLGITLEALTD